MDLTGGIRGALHDHSTEDVEYLCRAIEAALLARDAQIVALISRAPIARQREVLARRVADALGIDFVALVNVVEDAVGAGEL